MKRCVIIGGAPINNPALIKSYFTDKDYFIYCDSGLYHRELLSAAPNLIIGDFDSHEYRDFQEETIVLPVQKDDTDTFFAAKEGMRRGFKEFLLVGCIGLRFDHSLANISILLMLKNNGCHGLIVDDYSEMELIKGKATVSSAFSYFSLFTLEKEAKGLSIKNALYPLENAVLTNDYAYAISNEPLPGQTAEISLEEGDVLLTRIFDTVN